MNAIEKIESVLRTDLLTPQLIIVPQRGASDREIRSEEASLGRALCPDHVAILQRWNGIDLDVVRLYGCGDDRGEIERISKSQMSHLPGMDQKVVIGSDPSGFLFLQAEDQSVFELDTDGFNLERVASGLDDFFDRLVFGADAAAFGGDQWLGELRAAGVVAGEK